MEVAEKIGTAIESTTDSEKIYKKAFPGVAWFVQKMGGDFEDARDLFHDALVLYFEAVSKKDFSIRITEEAYILGIAKHLWIRKHGKKQISVTLTDMEHEISVPDDFYPSVENQRLLRFIKAAGKKCLDLLRVFYYQKSSVKNLAEQLGYPNEHAASVQKYKCLGKIRESIKQRSLQYEDFLN